MTYAGPADSVEAIRIANAQAVTDAWQAVFVVFLALVGVAVCAFLVRKAFLAVRRSMTGRELAVFAILACVCTFAAQKRLVSYPRTDPTTAYLTDVSSYVDSETDVVHLEFRRIIVPDTAAVYVDRHPIGDESNIWENEITTTFGDMSLPYEFIFENATNYQWIVYTDWTPGPTVQTNGVWHANWGLDRRVRRYLIPLRTEVRVDGEVISNPKQKEYADE